MQPHVADPARLVAGQGSAPGLTAGQKVVYSPVGGPFTRTIGGLTSGAIYYAIVVDPKSISLAATAADAAAGTAITLFVNSASAATGTEHTITTTSQLTDAERTGLRKAAVSVIVALREDINVAASGVIDASASGFIYLGSEVDMHLDRVDAGGKLRIKGGQSITDGAASTAHPNITGQDLILEAAAGSIGSATKPVRTDLAAGATLTARAGDDLYILEEDGDILVDAVYSVHHSSLATADVSIINGNANPLISGANVIGTSIVLNAQLGGIGAPNDDLQINTASGVGALTVGADTSAYVLELTGNLAIRNVTIRHYVSAYGLAFIKAPNGDILDGTSVPLVPFLSPGPKGSGGPKTSGGVVVTTDGAYFYGLGVGSVATPPVVSADYIEGDVGSDGFYVVNVKGTTVGGVTTAIQGLTVTGDIDFTTSGQLTLFDLVGGANLAHVVSNAGSVTLHVLDTSASGENIMMAGSALVSAFQDVNLLAGDDVFLGPDAPIEALGTVAITGDSGDGDPGVGTTIDLRGQIQAGSVQILSGPDADRVSLTNVLPGVPTGVATGGGGDQIHVGSNATPTSNTGGVLDYIGAPLTLDGGSSGIGTAILTLDDSGDTNNNVGRLTSTELSGLDMGGTITYSGLATLDLTLGSGSDELTVASTHAGTATSLFGELFANNGAFGNRLIGPDAAQTWSITDDNDGSASGLFANNSYSFDSFQNLKGGSQTDSFAFANDRLVLGLVEGGGSIDTLDFRAYDSVPATGWKENFWGIKPVTVQLATETVTTSADSGRVTTTLRPEDQVMAFSGIENLDGGQNRDEFFVFDQGGISGTIDGLFANNGANTLDFSPYMTAEGMPIDPQGHITGLNSGWIDLDPVTGVQGPEDITFTDVSTLVGDEAQDIFFFHPGGSITGMIDGGGSNDILDFDTYGGVARTKAEMTGSASSVSVGNWAAGSLHAVGVVAGSDGYFSGDEAATGGTLGAFRALAYDTANGGTLFGIAADALSGTVTLAGTVLRALDLPFANGDFRIAIV